MKLSSHLFFRIDGQIGRYPIISIDTHGTITNIEECEGTMREMAHQEFVCGILVGAVAEPKSVESALRESHTPQEFAEIVNRATKVGTIALGHTAQIDLIEGVDLNTFEASQARIRRIV